MALVHLGQVSHFFFLFAVHPPSSSAVNTMATDNLHVFLNPFISFKASKRRKPMKN